MWTGCSHLDGRERRLRLRGLSRSGPGVCAGCGLFGRGCGGRLRAGRRGLGGSGLRCLLRGFGWSLCWRWRFGLFARRKSVKLSSFLRDGVLVGVYRLLGMWCFFFFLSLLVVLFLSLLLALFFALSCVASLSFSLSCSLFLPLSDCLPRNGFGTRSASRSVSTKYPPSMCGCMFRWEIKARVWELSREMSGLLGG